MTINIHKFLEKFNEEYSFLYENHDRVAGYEEAVKAFDEFVQSEDNAKFVGEFAEFRGDFIVSDRECASFMFALESMENMEE